MRTHAPLGGLALALLLACTGGTSPSRPPQGQVQLSLAALSEAPVALASLELTFVEPALELKVERSIAPVGPIATAIVFLDPGHWSLVARALGHEGETILCGATTFHVLSGQTSGAHLVLAPGSDCALEEIACANGLDDDLDGDTDCDDLSCLNELCDDDNACTTLDLCQARNCAGSGALACDDGDACTVDSCARAIGCLHQPSTDPLCCNDDFDCGDDGVECTRVRCIENRCTQNLDHTSCPADTCRKGTCTLSGCAQTPVISGPCDDGNACTVGTTCNLFGNCAGGTNKSCADGDACTTDACEPTTGECSNTPTPDPLCCNTPADCADDGVACTTASCLGNTCAHVPDDALCPGGPCRTAACTATGCVQTLTPNAACDDGNACTTGDLCGGAGACTPGAATNCDDNNPCTNDACNPLTGCSHSAIAACCVNDNGCADDGIACTVARCAPNNRCVHDLDHTRCPDDVCRAGTCTLTGCDSTLVTSGACDDGDLCMSDKTCDGSGACSGGTPVVCDDDDDCTDDTCEPGSGCTFTPIPDAICCESVADCNDDGSACTTPVCADGRCDFDYDHEVCPDGVCRAGVCTGDGCFQTRVTSGPCDDGALCTVDKTCNAQGNCTGGTPRSCDDGDACTADFCDPTLGCVDTSPGECTVDGECATADPCVVGACRGGGTCAFTPLACAPLDACTPTVCQPDPDGFGASCVAADPITCDDDDPCTTDTCHATDGCTFTRWCPTCEDDADCDDTEPCTIDVCTPFGCVYDGPPEICGNGVADGCNGVSDFACVWFVDAASTAETPDGKSWATAFSTIQAAVDAGSNGDMIWVAAGTYRAAAANQPVVTLKNGIQVFGGFAGGEPTMSHRPFPLPETILSGDFDQSGTKSADDSYHVVVGAHLALLQSVTVRSGNAVGAGTDDEGGGIRMALGGQRMFIESCVIEDNHASVGGGVLGLPSYHTTLGMVLRDTIVRDNTAVEGAGILGTGTWILIDTVISENHATLQGGAVSMIGPTQSLLEATRVTLSDNSAPRGGAIALGENAEATLVDVVLLRNQATSSTGGGLYAYAITSLTWSGGEAQLNVAATTGGAMRVDSGTVALSDVAFTANSATASGGAMSFGGATVTLEDAIFSGNSADTGGALHAPSAVSVDVARTRFECNSATSGGAILVGASPLDLDTVYFIRNAASLGGGGIHASGTSGTWSDVYFYENGAVFDGGGAHLTNASTPTLRGVVFRRNRAGNDGGGLALLGSTVSVLDALFHLNHAQEGGGAHVSGGDATFVNATFAHNRATVAVGGLYARYTAVLSLVNGALWGNTAPSGAAQVLDAGSPSSVANSCVASDSDVSGGTANVSLDPGETPFVLGPEGHVFLVHAGLGGATSTSQCVDLGDDGAADGAAIDWGSRTTRLDRAIDLTPVDAGWHAAP